MRTASTTAKTNPAPPRKRRPRSEMNAFGKLMADMMEKAEQSGEPRMTLAEIEAEVIRRRAGGKK